MPYFNMVLHNSCSGGSRGVSGVLTETPLIFPENLMQDALSKNFSKVVLCLFFVVEALGYWSSRS